MKNSFIIKLKEKLLKKFCLGILLVCITGAGIAQEEVSSGGSFSGSLKYGLKFGTTINEFTKQQPHSNITQGITGGGFVSYAFNDKIGAQLEVSYFQQGGRLLNVYIPYYVGDPAEYQIDIRNKEIIMHNIEVPVLFKYSLNVAGFTLNGFIGPSFAYNLHTGVQKEVTRVYNDGASRRFTGEENITNNMEKIQYSATAGIGIELPVSDKYYILIDARYRYGINAVYEGYSYLGITENQGDLKNHSLYFTLGFGF